MPYIAFKSIHNGRGGGLWAKMFHYFQFNCEEFLRHYHKRSNVESTFSMIQGQVSGSRPEQERRGHGQRSSVQDHLPQHLLSHPRDARAWHRS